MMSCSGTVPAHTQIYTVFPHFPLWPLKGNRGNCREVCYNRRPGPSRGEYPAPEGRTGTEPTTKGWRCPL